MFKEYRTDSAPVPPKADSKGGVAVRNDFMDANVRGTKFDIAGSQRPLVDNHSDIWDNEELLSEYKNSGIAHKIVTKPAQDATRNGFRIIIPDNPELQDKYQKAVDNLNLRAKLTEELIYRALYGDGFLSIGINTTSKNEQLYDPINYETLDSIAFIHAFGADNVKEVKLGTDPFQDNYMKDDKLVIKDAKNGSDVSNDGTIQDDSTTGKTVVIDSTRYCHSTLDKMENDTWGTSVINRCRDAIQTMDSALFANIKLARYFSIKVYKSHNIANEPDPDKRAEYRRSIERGLTTASMMTIAPDEEIENVSTNISGIEALYEFSWQNLASASGIPKSILTGEQSGTLAGASQDVINYYDTIRAVQEDILKPQIKYIVRLLMISKSVADGYQDPDAINWSVEFAPLWSADDKTQAETAYDYARTLQTLLGSGVISSSEARTMLSSQSSNSNLSFVQPKNDSANDIIPTKEEIDEYQAMLDSATVQKNGEEVN